MLYSFICSSVCLHYNVALKQKLRFVIFAFRVILIVIVDSQTNATQTITIFQKSRVIFESKIAYLLIFYLLECNLFHGQSW